MAFSMRLFTSLLSILLLTACTRADDGYGFRINQVRITPGYQVLVASYDQNLVLSSEAIEALENGVPLTVRVELELRDANTLTLLSDSYVRYEIRYMPLLQQYRLLSPGGQTPRNFPRLRHALAALSELKLDLKTSPLAPGSYEFRARTRLDNARLPAPMRLPTRFSGQWQHDSGWSTWPFEINA
jgi:hypothetical protein